MNKKIFLFSLIFLLNFYSGSFAMADICSRSDSFVHGVEKQIGKKCQQISSGDLAKIETLAIRYGYPDSVEQPTVGDFDDLKGLKSFTLMGSFEVLPKSIFKDLTSLKTLNIYAFLNEIDPEVYAPLKSLGVT